jgi:hypothetical protein
MTRKIVRNLLPVVLAGAAVAAPAAAEELVAIHPGLMCRSERALVRLTLDDGSDKTLGKHGPADDIAKADGGCMDFDAGIHVTAVKIKVGTSLVTCAIGGVDRNFVVANADFMPASPPARVAGDTSPPGALPPASAASAASDSEADRAGVADDAGTKDGPPDTEAADAALLGGDASLPAGESPALATPAAAGGGVTVTGLAPGMDEDAAHGVLGVGYRFAGDQALGDPAVDRIAATGPDPNNTYRLGFVEGKLWFVNHMMVFPSGREPNLAHLVARLTEKYGPPSRVSQSTADGYRAWWQFDEHQKLVAVPIDHCIADAAPMGAGRGHGAPDPQFEARFTNDCPVVVSAMVLPDAAQPDLVARLQVILSEPQPMYAHLRASEAALARKKLDESGLAMKISAL